MTKADRLKKLYQENGLDREDTFIMEKGGRKIPIITRSGIEKIQALNDIDVSFTLEKSEPDHVIIKAIGVMFVPSENGPNKVYRVETYAEANPKNCTNTYPVMTCEKRALGRVVLKLAGFYKEGVFAEGENLNADGLD